MPKNIKTRIQNKHDLEVNWNAATGFIPLKGELIVYDIEVDENKQPITKLIDGVEKTVYELAGRSTPCTHERFKIGDGINLAKDLPFTTDTMISYGTADPNADVTSQFYFKYSLD